VIIQSVLHLIHSASHHVLCTLHHVPRTSHLIPHTMYHLPRTHARQAKKETSICELFAWEILAVQGVSSPWHPTLPGGLWPACLLYNVSMRVFTKQSSFHFCVNSKQRELCSPRQLPFWQGGSDPTSSYIKYITYFYLCMWPPDRPSKCTTYHVLRISYLVPRTSHLVLRTKHLAPRTMHLARHTSYLIVILFIH
jgi:hypothetical protein